MVSLSLICWTLLLYANNEQSARRTKGFLGLMTPEESLFAKLKCRLGETDMDTIRVAYEFAARAHDGIDRLNGSTFLAHVVEVANILADWQAPAAVIATGLLHDTSAKDSSKLAPHDAHSQIERLFGTEVANWVYNVQLLTDYHATFPPTWDHESVTDGDYKIGSPWVLRVLDDAPMAVVVKLADRLHSFQTQERLPDAHTLRTAITTMNIFVPLAGRLGMYSVRRTLQDLAFKRLEPEAYAFIEEKLAGDNTEIAAAKIVADIRSYLAGHDFIATAVQGPLSHFSAYVRYLEAKRAWRPWWQLAPIVVTGADSSQCYAMLGVLHQHWPCLTERFKDYFSNPKPNGYRALHTRLHYQLDDLSGSLSVYLRTAVSQLVADNGVTAQWLGVDQALLPYIRRSSPIRKGEIVVFSNDGAVKYLPDGATPLDFACAVHSTLIYQCIGALVNGRPMPLTDRLEDGMVVRILVGNGLVHPERSWMEAVKTPKAKRILSEWLQQAEVGAGGGRQPAAHPAQPASKLPSNFQDGHNWESLVPDDERHESLSRGLSGRKGSPVGETAAAVPGSSPGYGRPNIVLDQLEYIDRPIILAKCCNPQPPRAIAGLIKRQGHVVIHRLNCRHLRNAGQKVGARWGTVHTVIHVQVNILALNRTGLVMDVARAVADEELNMLSFHADANQDTSALLQIGLELVAPSDIDRLVSRLRKIASVHDVTVGSLGAAPSLGPRSLLAHTVLNPYSLKPVTADAFFGRETDLRSLLLNIGGLNSSESVLLWGPKRIGKTSILKEFTRRFLGANSTYLPIYFDAQGCSGNTTAHFLYQLMVEAANSAADPHLRAPQYRKMKREPLSFLAKFLQNMQRQLDGRQIILIIDEFPMLLDLKPEGCELEDLFTYFRYSTQGGGGVSFVLAGGGVLRQMLETERLASFLNIIHKQNVGPMKRSDARVLIEKPMRELVDFDPIVVDEILDLTVGHPYFLQTLCLGLFELSDQRPFRVTPQDFDTFLQEWLLDQSDERFAHLWGNDAGIAREVQERNQSLLVGMAHAAKKDETLTIDQLRRCLPRANDAEFANTLNLLLDMDVIERSNADMYCIRVPLFTRWLAYRFPLPTY